MEPQQPSKKQKRKQRNMMQKEKKKALPITTQQKKQSKSTQQKSKHQKSTQQATQQKHQAQRSKDHQPFYDNPIKTLKNLRPGAVYECVAQPYDSGMPHFVMTVSVDGQVYGGAGCKEWLAQTRAAQTALGKIHNLKSATKQADEDTKKSQAAAPPSDAGDTIEGATNHPTLDPILKLKTICPDAKHDCISKQFEMAMSIDGKVLEGSGQKADEDMKKTQAAAPPSDAGDTIEGQTIDPVLKLNTICPDAKYHCVSKHFVIAVSVNGEVFEGSSRKRKLAKAAAAEAALTKMEAREVAARPEQKEAKKKKKIKQKDRAEDNGQKQPITGEERAAPTRGAESEELMDRTRSLTLMDASDEEDWDIPPPPVPGFDC